MNNCLRYDLEARGFINRFIISGTFCRIESFEKCTLSGKVNEWLKYGFAIHENPCRKQFISNRVGYVPAFRDFSMAKAGDVIEEFGSELPFKVYFPFGNINIDTSTFYFNPTYLRSYAFTKIYADEEETADFTITTCGGVTVWADKELICDFTPFTRNANKTASLKIPIKKGITDITVCLDDLAERDTDYYFGLRYLGNQDLKIYLPMAESVKEESVKKGEGMLDDLYLEKEVYFDEPLVLKTDVPAPYDGILEIMSFPSISSMVDVRDAQKGQFQQRFQKGQTSILLEKSKDLLPEFYYLLVYLMIDGIEICRKLGTQIFSKSLLSANGKDITGRKLEAIEYLGHYGIRSVYRAAALYYLDREKELREDILFEDLKGIGLRKDCSDFYFVVILYLYKEYENKMSDELLKRIKEISIGFRYWIDEPGDDVMWFFSENHALLFHICQYFSGKLFPGDVFANSGMMGKQMVQKAEKLLDKWFLEFFDEFITEWNSSAYIPVDMIGLATLYNFEEEGSIFKEKAKKALDRIFRCIAINNLKGSNIVTFGRSYEEHLKGRYVAGTTSLLYVGYGEGHLNRCGMGYISFAMGDYEPPSEFVNLINLNNKITFENTQGFEGYVNTYLYKTTNVILSTAVNFKPFKDGYQECIVQAAIDQTAQVFINHPGEIQPYGKGRPNLWAGNGFLPQGVQYKGTSILKYNIPDDCLIDYTHAYWPMIAFDEIKIDKNFIASKKGEGYIGILAKNGLSMQKKGPYRNKELISKGTKNIWILEVADISEFKDINEFCDYLQKIAIIEMENDNLEVQNTRYGDICVLNDGNVYVDSEKIYQYPLSSEGILNWF